MAEVLRGILSVLRINLTVYRHEEILIFISEVIIFNRERKKAAKPCGTLIT